MGYKILKKEYLNRNNLLIQVHAPLVAYKARAGQFVILRPFCDSERIPLTISDYDSGAGVITLIFVPIGETTAELASLNVGNEICDVCGPLGNPTETDGIKEAVVIGGGVGAAIALPVAKELKNNGAEVTAILGFRNKDLIILEKEFLSVCDKVIVTTDDGSYGEKGSVVVPLNALLSESKPDCVIAIGSVVMMKFVSLATKPFGVKTVVSMNPIMIDGTGMCGGCRLTVGGETRFACVDGPDFDGHLVDFDELLKANARFSGFEHKRKESCGLFSKAGEKL